MLSHHRTRKTTPKPIRHPQSLHSHADEGHPQPQGADEDPRRRPTHEEALPHKEGRGRLPEVGAQPLHPEGRSRRAAAHHRGEGHNAPQEEPRHGGGRGPRRQLPEGVEH